MHHLRWGILGAGHIAQKFATGLGTIKDQAAAQAIGSRSLEKARAFAQEYGLARAYGSYEEVLSDREVDIVYIALPNHLHAEWALRCAQAGKHILCEKPATANAAELEQVLAAVKRHNVFFMEAFMYRCHPQWDKVRELIAAGEIGEVRVLHSVFAYNTSWEEENARMYKEMAGGGLMDVGCYGVSFSRWIACEEPSACHAVGHIGRQTEIDEQGAALLKFPSGIVASTIFALKCAVPRIAGIYGSKGSITLTDPWQPVDGEAAIILDAEGKSERFEIKTGLHLYANEALTVAKYINQRQCPAMTWQDSLGNMRALDALRASMGLKWEG